MSNSVLAGLREASWSLEDHASLVDGVWIPHHSSAAPVSYPEGARARLAELEDTSLWFRSRNLLIHSVLSRYTNCSGLLEVGAGNGCVSLYLQEHDINTVAVEPGVLGASLSRAKGVDVVIAGHLEDLALPSEAVEAVGLFDVIEHLENPKLLLSEVHRILQRGGWCLVTVPAHQSLWSQADDHAGHFRRYSRRSLHEELSACGFERCFSSYCFAGALPLLFALRTLPYRRGRRLTGAEIEESSLKELSAHGGMTQRVGWAASRVEARWLRAMPIPFGTSIVAAYRRP